MADDTTQYHCGCGYKTKSPEAAWKHSDDTGHMVTVSGVIKPSGHKSTPKVEEAIGVPVIETNFAKAEAEAARVSDFTSLKRRLGKKE